MSAAQVTLNGVEVFATVEEVKGGQRIRLDAGDWRGLGLRPGDRIRVRRGAGEAWYFVAGSTTDDDAATAFLSRELDGLNADATYGTSLSRGVLPPPKVYRIGNPIGPGS